jgi:hypothetical protein
MPTQHRMTPRTLQLLARLAAIALLVLIGFGIQGVPSAPPAGVQGGVSGSWHDGLQWASADAASMTSSGAVAGRGR